MPMLKPFADKAFSE